MTGAPGVPAYYRAINDTATAYPDDCGIKELVEQCVERSPDAVAVVSGDRELTYRELNRRANALAVRLAAAGVRAGDTVGVCVRRSPELIAGLLAVIKNAAAYLPFDESWPDARLDAMMRQADARVVVTEHPQALAGRLPGCRFVAADGAAPDAPPNPAVRCRPDHIAYVNFTSGSTGRPKGVPIRHRSVSRLLFHPAYARLDAQTTTLQLATTSFDAATFEIWGALAHGGTCVLYPSPFVRLSELRRVLKRHGVNVLFLTTALFNTIVDEAPETLDAVGTVLTGGEAHSTSHVERALQRYGPGRVVSVYGPTECTTFATYYPITRVPAHDSPLPIGRPIQNTRLYIVTGDRLCAPGETGEIWLSGPGLSPGYIGDPAETAERFVTCEIDGVAQRLYRTGDRGRLDGDGNVVFQGRLDDQVKVSGYRIEPGEVARHLNRCPDVKQSFVTAVADGPCTKVLVAFVVPRVRGVTSETLRTRLAGALPAYMVPTRIRMCDALPLAPTGKVDRRALMAVYEPVDHDDSGDQ